MESNKQTGQHTINKDLTYKYQVLENCNRM